MKISICSYSDSFFVVASCLSVVHNQLISDVHSVVFEEPTKSETQKKICIYKLQYCTYKYFILLCLCLIIVSVHSV